MATTSASVSVMLAPITATPRARLSGTPSKVTLASSENPDDPPCRSIRMSAATKTTAPPRSPALASRAPADMKAGSKSSNASAVISAPLAKPSATAINLCDGFV